MLVVTATLPLALVLAALVIRVSMPVANRIGLVDRPGGHKMHERQIPLVGGLGVYVALLVVLLAVLLPHPEYLPLFGALLVGAGLMFSLGIMDDIRPVRVRTRFLAQAAATLIAVYWGGIVLTDFGALLGNGMLVLGVLSLPMTLFAAAGVINALNMTDGIDGLSGLLSLISLALLGVVAWQAGAEAYLVVILALMGAVAGFLFFNLRGFGHQRAAVFLGDAGSTMLGFLFAVLFIGLSQGESRAMAPVTALWLFAMPLYDTVATMIRRIWLRRSPFQADRTHLHHLLLDAGCTVGQVVAVIGVLHLAFGIAGLVGWHLEVAEWQMFTAFIGLFAGYQFAVLRPWRLVPLLRMTHRAMDLPVAGVTSAFVGNLPAIGSETTIMRVLGERYQGMDYQLFDYANPDTGYQTRFAIVELGRESDAPRLLDWLKQQLSEHDDIVVRQFIPRQWRHNRRKVKREMSAEYRRNDRRGDFAIPVISDPSVGPGIVGADAA